MDNNILIFDKGVKIGEINKDSAAIKPNPDAPIQLLWVTMEDGTKIEVLYVTDMDYAIVLPTAIAENLNSLLDEGTDKR